jgi:(5R)-carbapenem-3-carboxylate synthase
MPLYLRQILEEETFEVKVLDQEYYGGQIPKDWYKIPVFIDQGWVRKLMILFPFEKEEKIKGWEVRMKGFTEKASENFFKDLKAYMTQHRYYYKHCWKEKDFLIFDNRKVLHSRSPFDQDSIRILYRAQVDVSKNPFNEILEKIACSGTQ